MALIIGKRVDSDILMYFLVRLLSKSIKKSCVHAVAGIQSPFYKKVRIEGSTSVPRDPTNTWPDLRKETDFPCLPGRVLD
jgi:hypothetical protein